MNDFGGVLSLQVDSLLKALRKRRGERCRELIAEAEAQASELLNVNRQQQRERVRQAIAEERKRREIALQQARNRIRAAESQKVQALYAELLREGWPELIAELERRWSDTESRKAWCEMLVVESDDVLGPAAWTIEHPGAWSAKDARWLTQTLKDRGVPEPTYRPDAAIRAGLKVRCGSACLDGTIDGLLSRRTRIEGRLLAIWEQLAQDSIGARHG